MQIVIFFNSVMSVFYDIIVQLALLYFFVSLPVCFCNLFIIYQLMVNKY